MVKLHALGLGETLAVPARVLQDLVHRIHPAVAAVFVDLICPEDATLAPVGQKAPRVAVAGARRIRLPRCFKRFAPAGAELLVKVDAAADISLLGDEPQRFVARDVKAPRRDKLLLNVRAARPELFGRIVRRSGIEHADIVRFGHRVHEAVCELRLVFTDGVNTDTVGNGDHLPILICMAAR